MNVANNTLVQYQKVIQSCKNIFVNKTKDYGTAWRILRLPSVTDQIFIKAQRIRTIQDTGTQKVNDTVEAEFIGIINYCIIALMQMQLTPNDPMELNPEDVAARYDAQVESTLHLQQNKNHDYNEAWRDMRVSSMTDLILMKIYRIKQIEGNDGYTIISEGIDANYRDIINYAVFCMIKLDENINNK
ncbi:MAG: DUF1599 domain-containing protein [Cytophagales bacterium]|nr:DUF1599 domain-containing protein [Cytophagales bacterium]